MNPKQITPIDPGKTDKKIQIVRPSDKKDCREQGSNPTRQGTIVGEFWAYIRTAGGREIEAFGKKFATCSHIVTANWDPIFEEVYPRDSLLFEGHRFEIVHVQNVDFQNVLAQMLVTEIVRRRRA